MVNPINYDYGYSKKRSHLSWYITGQNRPEQTRPDQKNVSGRHMSNKNTQTYRDLESEQM